MEVPTTLVLIEYHVGTPSLVEMPRMGCVFSEYLLESVPHYMAGGLRGFPREDLAL